MGNLLHLGRVKRRLCRLVKAAYGADKKKKAMEHKKNPG
jgi:hypothetical protein